MKTDNYKNIEEYIFKRRRNDIKPGLDRIKKAARLCGMPHGFFKSVHIAGTNGKGSVAAFIESALREGGYKTGLYTSPHIVKFGERIRINNKPVNDDYWTDVFNTHIKDIADELNLTFFEIATLLAFKIFELEKIDYAVIETGMGGRFDATNIIIPEVSVLTKISMDHEKYLGNTIEDIAKEKAGIIKENIPVFAFEPDSQDVKKIIMNTAAEKNCDIFFVNSKKLKITENKNNIEIFADDFSYKVKMLSTYQADNSYLSYRVCKKLGLKESVIKKGFETAFVPARFDIREIKNKTFLFDVGHNPQAADILCENIKRLFDGKKIMLIFGVMKDKYYRYMLERYLSCFNEFVFVSPDTVRAENSKTLLAVAKELALRNGKKDVKFTDKRNIANALEYALVSDYDINVVCGSFFTVGEAFEYFCLQP